MGGRWVSPVKDALPPIGADELDSHGGTGRTYTSRFGGYDCTDNSRESPSMLLADERVGETQISGNFQDLNSDGQPLASQAAKDTACTHFLSRLLPLQWPQNNWTPEILALVLAATSLVFIFLILVISNNRPLDQFNSRITLNALISVASQTGQMALIAPMASSVSQFKWMLSRRQRNVQFFEDFDDASRGFVSLVVLAFKQPRM